jgi:hypothetical protein
MRDLPDVKVFPGALIDDMHKSFEVVCAKLGLAPQSDKATALVVSKIVELANAGRKRRRSYGRDATVLRSPWARARSAATRIVPRSKRECRLATLDPETRFRPKEPYVDTGLRASVPKAEEYRKHAEECRMLAGRSHAPEERDMLLNMDKTWDSLAQGREAQIA